MKNFNNSKLVFIVLLIGIVTFTNCSKDDGIVVDNSTETNLNNWKFPKYKGKGEGFEDTLIIYPIVKGKLGQPFFLGEDNKKRFNNLYKLKEEHIKTWKFITSIIPFKSYDGLWTELAFTHSKGIYVGAIDGKNPNHFRMYLANDKFRPKIGTILHEFGHILTLHSGELNPKTPKEKCSTFWIRQQEACFKIGSYGDRFYKKFYKGQPYEQEYLKLVNDPTIDLYNEDEGAKLLTALVNKYKDAFYMRYSATNLAEDMAVSFEVFVQFEKFEDIKNFINENESLDQIKYQKIKLFFQDVKMNTLRKKIQKNVEAAKKIYGENIWY